MQKVAKTRTRRAREAALRRQRRADLAVFADPLRGVPPDVARQADNVARGIKALSPKLADALWRLCGNEADAGTLTDDGLVAEFEALMALCDAFERAAGKA